MTAPADVVERAAGQHDSARLADELARVEAELAAIEEHEAAWSPAAIRERRARLDAELARAREAEQEERAQAATALAEAAAELERLSRATAEACNVFVQAVEAVREQRPRWERARSRARAAGLPPSPYVPTGHERLDRPTQLGWLKASRGSW